MSIFFNSIGQLQLADEYDTAHNRLTAAVTELGPIVADAQQLLAQHSATLAVDELGAVAHELSRDGADVRARVHLLVEADARTAYLLSARSGRLLDRTLATQALHKGWTYDEALMRRELAELTNGPRPHTAETQQRIDDLTRQLLVLDAPNTVGNIQGDLDWNLLEPRVGEPLRIHGADPAGRGRQLLVRAMQDTANPDQILADEFQAFFHENGNLTIVLAGVTDLSNPQLGHNPIHNSERDLDQSALSSFTSDDLADNPYGQQVMTWTKEMIEIGVLEPGTPTVIIGHSDGGGTAFDLAADPHFNGVLLDVTHTVSAGYSTITRFDAIPETTRAVAIRNIWDVVALVEHQVEFADQATRERLLLEVLEDGANGGLEYVDFRATQAEDNLDRAGIDVIIPPTPKIDIVDTTTRIVEPNGIAIDFDGGSLADAGHHQDFYIEYLQDAEEAHLLDVFAELDELGFTEDAVAVSVDISRPLHEHDHHAARPS